MLFVSHSLSKKPDASWGRPVFKCALTITRNLVIPGYHESCTLWLPQSRKYVFFKLFFSVLLLLFNLSTFFQWSSESLLFFSSAGFSIFIQSITVYSLFFLNNYTVSPVFCCCYQSDLLFLPEESWNGVSHSVQWSCTGMNSVALSWISETITIYMKCQSICKLLIRH